jgi:ParB family chromosome partitioning protein
MTGLNSNNKRGLGKGLDALLSSTTTGVKKDTTGIAMPTTNIAMFSGKTIVSLNVEDIVPNPRQPRHIFTEAALKELSASIKEHGVAQPLLVRKKGDKYELIAGERRLRASKLAGLAKVPAVIKEMSDEESLEIAIIENVQREDLNAMDEAESYELLMQEFKLTQEQVAQKVGKARSSIANTLRLVELPKDIKESLRTGEITAGHARAILATGDTNAQLELWKKIINENMNVREAEKVSATVKKPAAPPKEKPAKPFTITTLEQELTQKFSTKVEVAGNEEKGTIQIKYFSRDDLDRIYALISRNEVI